jgi:hypothetical protein
MLEHCLGRNRLAPRIAENPNAIPTLIGCPCGHIESPRHGTGQRSHTGDVFNSDQNGGTCCHGLVYSFTAISGIPDFLS